MVIRALDHVARCFGIADGTVIAGVVGNALARGDRVILSFDGVSDVPSSFVNALLVSLLDRYGGDGIRANLSIVDANRQIADMIRRCMSNALRARAAA